MRGEYEGKAVAVIGDSTFIHSGITGLVIELRIIPGYESVTVESIDVTRSA